MKTVLELLRLTAEYFARHGVESPRLNAEHLLAHALGKRRIELYMEFDRPLGEAELAPLRERVARRAKGEPLQHLLGTVEFHGRTFASDKRALIPRPETEQLVELVLAEIKPKPRKSEPVIPPESAAQEDAKEGAPAAAALSPEAAGGEGFVDSYVVLDPVPGLTDSESQTEPASAPAAATAATAAGASLAETPDGVEPSAVDGPSAASATSANPEPALSILDVGTGSGVIALTLAAELPACAVTAVDISPDALALARENERRLGLEGRVRWLQSDLLSTLETGPRAALPSPARPAFDWIIANLPYIPAGEIAELSREVRHDPVLALDGGPIGTELIVRLLEQARAVLNPGGRLALEIGHDQAEALSAELARLGYRDIRAVADYQGVRRFLFAADGVRISC